MTFFASNLPALRISADVILSATISSDAIAYSTANVFDSAHLWKLAEFPQTIIAALFAVAFFGTGTATVASATAFVASHAAVRLLDLSLSKKVKDEYYDENKKMTLGSILILTDRAFRVSASVINATSAIFMAATNPTSLLNIVGAIYLSAGIVNAAAFAYRGHWNQI